jgi:hypothetical protein
MSAMADRLNDGPSLAAMTPDELSRHYSAEMNRVEGPASNYSCWYDRGWFRTSKGNTYRRADIERFAGRLHAKPDFDGTNLDEDSDPAALTR